MHVIDLENLVGWPHNGLCIERAWFSYEDEIGLAVADRVIVVVVGTSLIAPARAVVPPHLPLVASQAGRNQADLLLGRLARQELAARRFDTVIIGSGDHSLVPTASAALDQGAQVWVVTGVGAASRKLTTVASLHSGLSIPTRRRRGCLRQVRSGRAIAGAMLKESDLIG